MRVDHRNPSKFRLRCPDCNAIDYRRHRPGKEVRECGTCNRLRGVTPLSTVRER